MILNPIPGEFTFVADSVTITGTVTTAESQVLTDNGAFVDGTSKVFMGGYIFDETAGTALTENDAAASRIDSKRAQVHVIEDQTTRGRRMTVGVGSDWSNTLNPALNQFAYVAALNHQLWPTTGSRSGVAGDGLCYGQLMNDLGDLVTSLGSVTSAAGSVQILTGPGDGDGAGTNSGGGIRVNIAATAHDGVDRGNPIKIGGKAFDLATPQSVVAANDRTNAMFDLNGRLAVAGSGDAAHDASDIGNPVKIGGKARNANPTAVANNDRADLFVDLVGRPVVTIGQVRGLKAQNDITLSSATETTLLAAGASGVFHDVVLIHAKNYSASAVRVDIRDATAGTVRFSLNPPPGGSDGFSVAIPVDQTSAANNWTAQLSAAVTDVRIFIHAIKNVA